MIQEKKQFDTHTGFPDFEIKNHRWISRIFIAHKLDTFHAACDYIRRLPYGRNPDKNRPESIFTDGCGTCSTKHALLKLLADENGLEEINLILCIYRMNAQNTPELSGVLKKYQLEYLPEAHNYLSYNFQLLDFTKLNSNPGNYENDVVFEMEIKPADITDFKVKLHRNYLRTWLKDNPQIAYTADEIWNIREQCIEALSH